VAIAPPPRPNRDNAFKDLNASGIMGGSASGLMGRSQPQRRLLPDFVAPVKEPEKAGNGLFDIPILGQIIDTLDTARAGIVSGVKEVGDIFDSDNSFSVTEWYDQTKDNIMMGEVLRDWDVDLPGPLDFVVGLGLDIALDPLTYALGAGVLLRGTKTADIALGLKKLADASTGARKADILSKMTKVNKTGSKLAAGKYLDELGLSSGMRMSMPGTGKLGRTIIEKPLRKIPGIGKKIGNKLDDLRVTQVTGKNVGPSNIFRYGDEAPVGYLPAGAIVEDLTDPQNIALVREGLRALRAGEKLPAGIARGGAIDKAIKASSKMLVEVPGSAKFFAKIPGSTGFVTAVAAGPGRVFGQAADTKMGQSFAKAFSSNAPVNQMIRSADPDVAMNGRWIQRTQSNANVASSTYVAETTQGAENIFAKAKASNIDAAELMEAAQETPEFLRAQGSKFGVEGSAEALLAAETRQFIEQASIARNNALPFSDDVPDLLGELYMMKYLSQEGAEALGKKGRLNGMFNPGAGDDALTGNSLARRKYLTPNGIKETISDPSGKLNKDVISGSELRKQLGIKADASDADTLAALDEALEEGVLLKLKNGSTVSNKTSMGAIRNPDGARGIGSSQQQMSAMGKEAYGDDWVEIFSKDFEGAVAKYIEQQSRFIRSQYMVDGLAQRGIIVKGVDGKLTRKAGERLGQAEAVANRKITNASQKEVALLAQRERLESLIIELSKLPENLRPQIVSDLLNAPGVQGVKDQADNLIGQMAKLDGEIAMMREAADAILYGKNVKIENISQEALALLRGELSVVDDAGKIRKVTLRNEKTDLAFKQDRTVKEIDNLIKRQEDAAEVLNIYSNQIKNLESISMNIRKLLQTNPGTSPQGISIFLKNAAELDKSLAFLKKQQNLLKNNYVKNVLDDVTVTSYKEINGWLRGQTFGKLYEFDAKGKLRLSKRTPKTDPSDVDFSKVARKVGRDWDKSPQYAKWKEDMGEFIALKELLKNSDGIAMVRNGDAAADVMKGMREVDELLEAARLKQLQAQLRRGVDTKAVAGQKVGPGGVFPRQARDIANIRFVEAIDAKLARSQALRENFASKMRGLEEQLAARRAKYADKKGLTDVQLTEENLIIVQQQKLVDDINLERQTLLSSDITATRIDAADSQLAAVNELKNVRSQAALSEAYGGKLNEYMVSMSGLDNLTGVSDRTKKLLSNYSLVGGASDESVELFAAAVQAAAKTQDTVAMSKFMKQYSSVLNWWKAQAISTPGFILRNMMGGFWMNNQLAGVPMGTHQRVMGIRRAAAQAANDAGRPGDISYGIQELVKAGKPVRLKGKFGMPQAQANVQVDELLDFDDWYKTGVASSGQVSQEVTSALSSAGNNTWRNALVEGSAKPWSADFKPFALVRRANQDAEFMMRGALAHHIKTSGGDVGEAFAAVRKYHFDYSDLTNAERKIKQVIPFYTWQKNVIPVLVESIGKNPTAWGRIAQVKKEIELNSPVEGMVPSFFAENMGIRLPFSTGDGQVYAIPDLPFRDLARWSKGFQDGSLTEMSRPIFESAVPFVKLPVELWAGKRSFADIPFSGRYQQVPAWGKIPGLMEALSLKGWAKKNSKGEWKITDREIYKVEQFLPWFGRIARLIPNEKGKQERLVTTWVSTVFGTNVRANTASSKRNEKISRDIERSQERKDLKDLERRVR
jgi:hypothetical protein